MADIDVQIDRLQAALGHTSWRCEVGAADPAHVARAEAKLGPLPDDFRRFISRVTLLENHAGDVTFFTARDLADEASEPSRLLAEWRHADEEASRADAGALAEVQAFWSRIVPVLCSTVQGDDFLAIDRGQTPPGVIAACGESGWSDGARLCASSFTHFLAALVDVFEAGPAALDEGWRLGRKTVQQLHALDARYREPMIPIVFVTDFDAASPPRRSTRPPRSLSRR